MQLTSQEMKLVERLRKEERRWLRTRWILLVVGFFVFACWGYILILAYRNLDFQNLKLVDVLFFAMVWPKFLMMFLFGTCLIGWAIRDWHGNVNRKLLLKLLDAQLKGDHEG